MPDNRIIKFSFSAICVFIFLIVMTSFVCPPSGSIEQDILYYVNVDRKSKGLKPLKINEVESAIATQHSKDMASGRVPFGHEGLDARAKKIRKQLGPITMVGENVASGPMTAKEAVEGWLQSPGHKRNIEGDFTLTGIGWAKRKNGVIYFTQIFTK